MRGTEGGAPHFSYLGRKIRAIFFISNSTRLRAIFFSWIRTPSSPRRRKTGETGKSHGREPCFGKSIAPVFFWVIDLNQFCKLFFFKGLWEKRRGVPGNVSNGKEGDGPVWAHKTREKCPVVWTFWCRKPPISLSRQAIFFISLWESGVCVRFRFCLFVWHALCLIKGRIEQHSTKPFAGVIRLKGFHNTPPQRK